jgi:hypothetical protein
MWNGFRLYAESMVRAVEIHRLGVGGEAGCHALYVLLLVLGDRIAPCGTSPNLAGLESRQQSREGRGDIPDDRRGDSRYSVNLRLHPYALMPLLSRHLCSINRYSIAE